MQMRKNMQKLMLVAICLLLAVSSFAQIAPTPANERIKGLEKKSDLIRQSTINDVAFRNIGPSIMRVGWLIWRLILLIQMSFM